MRTLISFLLFIVYFLLFISPVFADSPKFAVSQEIIYQMNQDNKTTVTENFAFTNLTSEYFPQEFKFDPGNITITNLKASDRLGPLSISSTNSIIFKDQVVSIGKILRWSLSFDTFDFVQKKGTIREINIPAPPKISGLTNLAIRLNVPRSWGQNIYIKPRPENEEYFWTTSTPVLAAFNSKPQVIPKATYNFYLKYHLYNSRLYPAILEIALPPDTEFQRIYLNSLSVPPVNVVLDDQGNWLARYQMGPVTKLEVSASGSAEIFLTNQSPPDDLKPDAYLRPEKYWPSDDKFLKDHLGKLATPLAIYNYTIKTLAYNPDPKNERLGPRARLLTAKDSSMYDFSDLFITAARIANIPARQVNGIIISRKNSTHVWPQYFDLESKAWTNIDPGLAKITSSLDYFQIFDLDHLAIFIKSGNKSAVLPDEINITPSDYERPSGSAQATAALSFPSSITAGFSVTGSLEITNLGPTLLNSQHVSVSSSTLKFDNQVFVTAKIPPFGRQKFSVTIKPQSFTTNVSDIITLRFGLEKHDYPVQVIPLYKNNYLVILGGLIFFGILSIIAQIARGLLIQKRPRPSHLRGEGKKSS